MSWFFTEINPNKKSTFVVQVNTRQSSEMVEQIRLSRVGSIFNGVGVQVKHGLGLPGETADKNLLLMVQKSQTTTWDVYNTFGYLYISTGKRRISEPSTVIKWGETLSDLGHPFYQKMPMEHDFDTFGGVE